MPKVSATRYEMTWGFKPRGRGTWTFRLVNGKTMSGEGTYTEARNACAKEAQKMGTRLVEVLP